MSSLTVELPDDLNQFLQAEATAGGFADRSELVEQILRAFWKEKAKTGLERKLLDSLESGHAIEATPEFWDDLRARVHLHAEAATIFKP